MTPNRRRIRVLRNCPARVAVSQRSRSAEPSASDALRSSAAHCSALAKQANDALAAFQAKARRDIENATKRLDNAQRDLSGAQDVVHAHLSGAEAIERQAIAYRSLSVLGTYVSSDPVAIIEIVLLFAVSVAIQFAPLALKSLIGRSAPGARIMAEHEIAVAEHLRRRENALRAMRALQRPMTLSKRRLLTRSPTLRQQMAAELEKYLLAFAPLEATRRSAEAFGDFIASWDEKIRRYPRFAEDFNLIFEPAKALRLAAAA